MSAASDETKKVSNFPPESNKFSKLANRVVQEISPDMYCDSYFHYTSAAGLQGIIESNSLYFADSLFVNDESERRWGIEVLEEVVGGLKTTMSERPKHFLEDMVRAQLEVSEDFRSVIFCMSLEGNLLNQWRDYGKDVVPYCIEFDAEGLWREQDANFSPALIEMEYDHNTQKVLVGELLNRIFAIMEPLWDTMPDDAIYRMAVRASFQIGILLEQFKHPAFSAEKEVRLQEAHYSIVSDGVLPHFRPSSLGLVPYYVWSPKNKLKIKSVTVGPSPHSDASAEALKQFLRHHNIDADTKISGIPIRR